MRWQVNLAFAYTESINTGSVPSIQVRRNGRVSKTILACDCNTIGSDLGLNVWAVQNAWNYICESKCQHALTVEDIGVQWLLTEALKHYENTAKDLLVELPMVSSRREGRSPCALLLRGRGVLVWGGGCF